MENIDILNGELFIPMNENSKPNLDDILMKLNYLSETYGIPYNRTKFFEKWDEYFDKYKEMYERLKSMTGKTYINMDAKKQDDSHPAIIIQKASGIPEEYFKNEKGKFSLNDFVMKKLKTNFSDNDYIKVIVDLKKYDNLVSNAKQLKDLMISDKVKPIEDNPDLVWIKPTFRLGETFRIVSTNPNLQGLTGIWKTFIEAPKGYKIINIDIGQQEPHILIWGLTQDERLKELSIIMGDNYSAFVKRLGFDMKPEFRDMLKVSILSFMNGMAKQTLEIQLNDSEIVDSMFSLFEEDPKFKSMISKSRSIAKTANPYTKGLFGTTRHLDTYETVRGEYKKVHANTLYRKILNGNFQITAAEIIAMSLNHFMTYCYNQVPDRFFGMRPLVPIYDEIICLVKDDYIDTAGKAVEYFFRPRVEGWERFYGNYVIGQSYEK